MGGGGGGGSYSGTSGGEGGYGGLAAGFVTFTDAATVHVGIGVGGSGNNGGTGVSGQTSNVGSMTASGGVGGAIGGGSARGADGSGTNGVINTNVDLLFGDRSDSTYVFIASLLGSNIFGKREYSYIGGLGSVRSAGTGLANVRYTSMTTTVTPGSGGTGETTSTSGNNASGGGDGAVLIFY
jgi:hypothetical protein